MANLIILAVGGQSTYASCGFTFTDFNSLANGSTVLASTADDNSTNLDDAVEISFSFANGATTTTAASRFDLYFLPFNQDASTYGDGSTSGATFPSASYRLTTCGVRAGITTGGTLTGAFPIIAWPTRATGKWLIANRTGGALNATSAAAVKYRGYRFNTNG